MVTIESIRIGNILQKDGVNFKVTPVIMMDIFRNPDQYKYVRLKDGLKYISAQDKGTVESGYEFKGLRVVDAGFDIWEVVLGYNHSRLISSIHELQNIYYALTAAELPIINIR